MTAIPRKRENKIRLIAPRIDALGKKRISNPWENGGTWIPIIGNTGMNMDRQQRIVQWTGWVCLLAIPVAASCAAIRLDLLRSVAPPTPTSAGGGVSSHAFAAAPHVPAETWAVLRPISDVRPASAEPVSALASRYRLAGTFFVFGSENDESRRAIIDDVQLKAQTIARQGDALDGYRLVEVGTDRATFERGAERVTLTMGFTGPSAKPLPQLGGTNAAVALDDEEKVLEESAFGKRVAETRWVLSRTALMAYYQDLLENPERIASLYTSMKPDYRNEEIAGYRVNQEGERDFFKAVGLQEGDVVRKVNSMNMTSQSRAEYFIGEFVKNRMNAVVIDVEREGRQQKMIYLVR